MSSVLNHILAIAKGLSGAELHVLMQLAGRAEATGGRDAIASSRELAEQTGLSRSTVQLAIDSLQKKGLIYVDARAASQPGSYRLLFLDAVEIQSGGPIFMPEVARESGQGGPKSRPGAAQFPGQGGPIFMPVVARESGQGGLKSELGVAQFSGQGGLISVPPPNEESGTSEHAHIENASAPAESIEKDDFKNLIDRIQNSKKADFDDEVFEAARDLIASHHAKFAREGSQLPGKPDDQITAQFLAVADWPRLSRMLHDLLTERQSTSFSWGWYVTVALQRIHGISPEKVRQVREKGRNSNTSTRTVTHTLGSASARAGFSQQGVLRKQITANGSAGDFREQVRALAASKSMR